MLDHEVRPLELLLHNHPALSPHGSLLLHEDVFALLDDVVIAVNTSLPVQNLFTLLDSEAIELIRPTVLSRHRPYTPSLTFTFVYQAAF
jgi:hypothetical protein